MSRNKIMRAHPSFSEADLYNKMRAKVDHADGPPANITDTRLGRGAGNPAFVAQFDLVAELQLYTIVTATGVYTKIAASALDADILTDIPFFFFGQADFQAAYKKGLSEFPNQNALWTTGKAGIFKKDSGFSFDGQSVVENELTRGDGIMELTSTEPGGGTTSLAVLRIKCNQVAYGTLLDFLSSSTFVLNKIRYKVPSGKEEQFNSDINISKQSIFGASSKDSVSPNAFLDPDQNQPNIVDIPINQLINKEVELVTYMDLSNENVTFTWSIYVSNVNK